MDKVVSGHFKMVFLCVFALTLITLAAVLCMSVFIDKPDASVNGAIAWTESLCKISFGGMVGLIGGRAA